MQAPHWTLRLFGGLTLLAVSGCYSPHPYGYGSHPGYYGTAPPGTVAPGSTMPGTVMPGTGPTLAPPGGYPSEMYQPSPSGTPNSGIPADQFLPPVQGGSSPNGQGGDPFYGSQPFAPSGNQGQPTSPLVPEYESPGPSDRSTNRPTGRRSANNQPPNAGTGAGTPTGPGTGAFESGAEPFPKNSPGAGTGTFESGADPFPKGSQVLPQFNDGPQLGGPPQTAEAIHDAAVAAIPIEADDEFFPPTTLKPVSASYAVPLGDDAAEAGDQRRPNPYDHDRQGFRWLRGIINFDEQNQKWYVIYSVNPAADDEFGGEIALADSARLDVLNNGEVVYVEGRIDPTTRDNSGKPCYRVDFLAQLVPKER